MLLKRVKGSKINIANGIIFLIFFASIILMQYLGNNTSDVSLTIGFVPLVKLFFVGVIASATMVIPGVSGSMMLMIMGYYNPILNAITEFVSGLTQGDMDTVFHVSASLIPFGIGVVLGIFVIAKIIEILLKKWEGLTYSAILGLVVSSPVVILMGTVLSGLSIVTVITGFIALAAGGAVALKLGK